MRRHSGDIEWIAPLPSKKGAALAYNVKLNEADAERRIDELIQGIQDGGVPTLWVLTPLDTPANLLELLVSKGFKDLYNPEEPEPGMALWAGDFKTDFKMPFGLAIVPVNTREEFATWVQIVNEELFERELLDADGYYFLIEDGRMPCYLALLGGAPAAAAATIRDGAHASLEFVATRKEHRRKGIGRAVCAEAMRRLKEDGVRLFTLRACAEGVPLYRKMGFTEYYNSRFVVYKPVRQ